MFSVRDECHAVICFLFFCFFVCCRTSAASGLEWRAKWIIIIALVFVVTFFGRAKAVVPRHVLNVVHKCRVGQNGAFAIQPVDGVLEGQFCAAVLLILSEDSTCQFPSRIFFLFYFFLRFTRAWEEK